MNGTEIGEITHFFDRISVAVVKVSGTLRVGDTIHILGPHTDLRQAVSSMQIEHAAVTEVGAGQEVAIKTDAPVRVHDKVYLVTAPPTP